MNIAVLFRQMKTLDFFALSVYPHLSADTNHYIQMHTLLLFKSVHLAAPGEARGCSTNTFVTH